MAGSYRIGRLAKAAGLSIKAIRFYESRGLLPPASRTASGYRFYSEADLRRLEFITQAKALGLSLGEIQKLGMTIQSRTCAMARPKLLGILDQQIRRTSSQIGALTELRHELLRRRRLLMSRPPTDHRQGYCSCLHGGQSGAPKLLNVEPRASVRSGVRERR
jgi:DNA-binding transcriptional MerR regulator